MILLLLGCPIEIGVSYERSPIRVTEPPREVLCGIGEPVVPSGLVRFSAYWAEYRYLRQGTYLLVCERPHIDAGLVTECVANFGHDPAYCSTWNTTDE